MYTYESPPKLSARDATIIIDIVYNTSLNKLQNNLIHGFKVPLASTPFKNQILTCEQAVSTELN